MVASLEFARSFVYIAEEHGVTPDQIIGICDDSLGRRGVIRSKSVRETLERVREAAKDVRAEQM